VTKVPGKSSDATTPPSAPVQPAMTQVGVFGLGKMDGVIARNLLSRRAERATDRARALPGTEPARE
jgi:hypothetical protein